MHFKRITKQQLKDFLIPTVGILVFSWYIIHVVGSNTRCLIRGTIGIPCPGCGITRAYDALLHGHILEAFHYHPLFLLPPIIIFILLFRKQPKLNKIYNNDKLWWIIIGLFLVVYILRMILMFPDQLPMQFNEEAIVPTIYHRLIE